ncbi:MAG: Na+/H+ antiporter subunit E [Acidimicrobiia bacterium]|nr:Na+/H+ antiporter subunit E [Acidimicrobiia bacterium]
MPAIIEVPLRARTRNQLTLLMNSISFTPGTVALELHDNHLIVHVLNTDDPGEVAAEIRTMESKIMAVLSRAEFEDATQENVWRRWRLVDRRYLIPAWAHPPPEIHPRTSDTPARPQEPPK